jgi:class 3 adenylate cyclase
MLRQCTRVCTLCVPRVFIASLINEESPVNAQPDESPVSSKPPADAPADVAPALARAAASAGPSANPSANDAAKLAPLENRSFVGAILLVDIVEFTKKSVAEQLLVKDRFTAMLSEALKDIDPDERLILDTGDGAALTFLGDVDDALFVAMRLREYLRRAGGAPAPEAADQTVPLVNYDLHIALNVGPVKLFRDSLGHPSVVGDGVNVAQRIVGFANSGQIVASRAYCKEVCKISAPYKKLFSFHGAHTDKHVREHELYAVGEADRPLAELFNKNARVPPVPSKRSSGAARETASSASAGWFAERKTLAIAMTALALLVLGLGLALMWKKPTKPAAEIAKNIAPTLEPVTPASPAPPPPVVTAPATPAPAEAAPPPVSPEALAKAAEEKRVARAAVQGVVNFSIQPWGNVYINGKPIGASPPLKQTRLAPGKYRVEVRNVEPFTPYIVNIDVKAREEVVVRHKF